jgi:hypothetical protein
VVCWAKALMEMSADRPKRSAANRIVLIVHTSFVGSVAS